MHSLINALVRYDNIHFIFISPEELTIPDYIIEMLREKNVSFSEVRKLEGRSPPRFFLHLTFLDNLLFKVVHLTF